MSDTEHPSAAMPKFSRYRSVRQASANKTSSSSATDDPKEIQATALQKSRSRYRRPRAASTPLSPGVSTTVPATPTIPQQYSAVLPLAGGGNATARNAPQDQPHIRPTTSTAGDRRREPKQIEPYGAVGQAGDAQFNENRLRRQKEYQRRREEEEYEARSLQRLEDENARKLEEQKRKDLERLEAELAAAAARPTSPRKSKSTKDNASSVEKLFSLKRAASKKNPPKATSIKAASDNMSASHQSTESKGAKGGESSQGIVQGGGGIVPGIDAPMSAVNAGERRVLIRCKQSSINLPVTPETTPVDLIYTAANILSQSITPSAAILLESYTPLGLERRLRRYERIRNIMNSWDRDTQNSLIIEASDSPNHDTDLEAFAVPKEQPANITVHMYHSQKPGKWSKRYITLLSTGQIFLSKKAGSKVSDKDIITLCHLTDFDIYTPTPHQIRKCIKPPKKHCYAVKSQQRTNMFLNTDNFVHFFCTDDSALSDKWHDAVQRWRSWYLVHMKGEAPPKSTSKPEITIKAHLGPTSGKSSVHTHRMKISVDESPYTIGSFKPLLDLSRFGSPPIEEEEEAKGDTEEEKKEDDQPVQIPFHHRNGPRSSQRKEHNPPPVSLTRHNLPASGNEPITSLSSDNAFSPTSLLGQTYAERQRAQKEREAASQENEGPFVSGPSLLNNASTRPRFSLDNNENGFGRSITIRTKRPETSAGPQHGGPKPLIDLTPKLAEAQQWSRQRKGHGVSTPAGVPLVEAATCPDAALNLMARTYRKDAASCGVSSGIGVNGRVPVKKPLV